MRTKTKRRGTYNSQDSLVVTDLTTNWPLPGLSKGEQTGPRVLQELWSYVFGYGDNVGYIPRVLMVLVVTAKAAEPDRPIHSQL